MVASAISLYLLLMLVFCFIRLRLGIAMYLLYQILVPFVNIQIGSFSFGPNLINLTVLLGLFYTYREQINVFIYKPLVPFFFLYFTQFFMIPFQTGIPMEDQLNYFRVDIMGNLLLPFVMINVMKFDKAAYRTFTYVLIVGILIAVVYGLFLTLIPGVNPWLILVLPLSGSEFNDAYAFEVDGGRLFGRISSVFGHPMTFGLFLCLSFVYIYSLIKPGKPKIAYLIILLFITGAIFICGIRTPIGTLVVIALFYLFTIRKFKLVAYGVVFCLVSYFILIQVPAMDKFISSIFDMQSTNVEGSSLDLRIEQLQGCMDEIKGSELVGLGYGWTTNYISIHTTHPVIWVFESLLYVILCNNGFLGIGVWVIMGILYFRHISARYNRNGISLLLTLLLAYLTYSLITGEYGYMRYFLVFYCLILAGLERNIEYNPRILKRIKLAVVAKKINIKRNKNE